MKNTNPILLALPKPDSPGLDRLCSQYGFFIMKNKSVVKRQLSMNENSTYYEKKVIKFLESQNIEYIQNYPVRIDDDLVYNLDFYLVGLKCYLEIDGKHHWTDYSQVKHDRARAEKIWAIYRYTEVRIRNSEVDSLNYRKLQHLIKKAKKKYSKYNGPVTLAQKVMKNKQIAARKKL